MQSRTRLGDLIGIRVFVKVTNISRRLSKVQSAVLEICPALLGPCAEIPKTCSQAYSSEHHSQRLEVHRLKVSPQSRLRHREGRTLGDGPVAVLVRLEEALVVDSLVLFGQIFFLLVLFLAKSDR